MRASIVATALVWASSAQAATAPHETDLNQSIVNFDNVTAGTTSFTTGGIDTHISGGTVVAATAANPAYSGTQAYGGTSILVTFDPAVRNLIDYSWPDIGAFVTGSASIKLELSAWDPDAFEEQLVLTTFAAAGSLHYYLSGSATDENPGFYTTARFTSDEYFTLDRLMLGLPNVGPGVPEPASWALLIGGFALTGARLRFRRAAA